MHVWMASVGISPSRINNYTQLLVQEEIDQKVIEILTLEQLEKLGIPMGPRSLIFNAAQSGELYHDSILNAPIVQGCVQFVFPIIIQ